MSVEVEASGERHTHIGAVLRVSLEHRQSTWEDVPSLLAIWLRFRCPPMKLVEIDEALHFFLVRHICFDESLKPVGEVF